MAASWSAVPVVVSQTAEETATRSAIVHVTTAKAPLLKGRTGDPEDPKGAPAWECQDMLLQCSGYGQPERLYGARVETTHPKYISQ